MGFTEEDLVGGYRPPALKEDMSIDYRGKKSSTAVDLLKASTIFGAIGDKYTVNKDFESLYAGNIFKADPKFYDEDGSPKYDGEVDGAPFNSASFFASQTENIIEAKAHPVEDAQWKSLEEESDFVKLQMADDGIIDSKFKFEQRRFYLREQERKQRNIDANAEWTDYGLMFLATIGDADSLVTGGVGAAFSATAKGVKILDTAARNPVKTGMLSGAVYSSVNQLIMNDITGTSTDNDVLIAGAMGATLGTTLGWLGSRISMKPEGKHVVDADGVTMTKGEALHLEITKKQAEIDEITKLKEANLQAHAEAKITADDAGKGTARYKAKLDKLGVQKSNLERQLNETIDADHSKLAIDTAKQLEGEVGGYIKKAGDIQAKHTKLSESIRVKEAKIKARQDTVEYIAKEKKVTEEIQATKKEVSGLKAKVQKLSREYKKSLKDASTKVSAKALKRLDEAKAALVKSEDKVKTLTKDKNIMKATKPTYTRPPKKPIDVKADKDALRKLSKEITDLKDKALARNKQLGADMKAIDDMRIKARNEAEGKLKSVSDKIRALSFRHQDLVRAEARANEELASLNSGKLSDNYTQEVITAKEKLQQQLDDYLANPASIERLMENPIFKIAPSNFKKFVISPIEKLYHSDNRLVASLASLLSPPVIAKEGYVNNLNAKTYIKNAKMQVGETLNMIDADFKAYKAAGGTEYTLHSWLREVHKQRALQIGEQQRKNVMNTPNIEKDGMELSDIMEGVHMNASYTFKHGNTHLSSSMQKVEDYYSAIKKQGTDLEIDGLMNTRNNGYVQQTYSEDVARAMGEDAFVKYLVDAQRRYAKDHGLADDVEAFTGSAKKAFYMATSENQRYEKMFSMFNRQSGTSPIKQRSIRMYADDAAEVVDHNLAVNLMVYGRSMGGRFALKKFLGVNNKSEVEGVLRNIDGITPEEVELFNVLVDTVAGYREAVSYKAGWEKGLHSLSTVTSMLHTMNFGISAATEITTVVANTGFKNTVKSIIPGFKKTMEIYKHGGNEADFRQLTVLRDVGAHKFGNEVNRFELGENLDKYGVMQDTMDNIVHKEAKYSGLLMFTDWFKVSAQMASQDFIAEASKNITKISKADRKRLNQIGLNDQHLTELNKHMYKDGKFTGLNRDKWSDELNEIVDRGSMTQAYNSILHPDGFTLPAGTGILPDMTDGSNKMTKLLNNSVLKFMKFPVASYEALLLQGISTLDAKVIVGTSLNMAMWSQIILAKDRLNNWGEDSKLKYDLESDEGWHKLLIDSLQVMSVTGSLAAGGNMGSALLTGESMEGYSKSIGDSVVLSDMQRTLNGDVPLSLYGVQLMKTLENLDLVHSTFTPKMGFERSYGLGGE